MERIIGCFPGRTSLPNSLANGTSTAVHDVCTTGWTMGLTVKATFDTMALPNMALPELVEALAVMMYEYEVVGGEEVALTQAWLKGLVLVGYANENFLGQPISTNGHRGRAAVDVTRERVENKDILLSSQGLLNFKRENTVSRSVGKHMDQKASQQQMHQLEEYTAGSPEQAHNLQPEEAPVGGWKQPKHHGALEKTLAVPKLRAVPVVEIGRQL